MNILYDFFLKQGKDKVLITSGAKFLKVFSSSERIITDLQEISLIEGHIFNQITSDPSNPRWNEKMLNIWGREWFDYDWYEEFRCFFMNGSIVAISQYDQRCCFEELQGKDKEIKETILIFFQKMKPSLMKLGMAKGVVDIAVKNLKDPTLVEINVYDQNSRASLFNWEEDKITLQGGGSQQIPIRILSKQSKVDIEHLSTLMGMIEKGTEEILQRSFTEVGLKHLLAGK